MENGKQTAVEWLFDKITQNQEIRWRGTQYRDLFEQAKQMEKEQILEAYNDGAIMSYTLSFKEPFVKGEQYYNETYGK